LTLDKQPFVSVIIPTYQSWDSLAICLNAIFEQDYPSHLFEVIVVNNDPLDKIPEEFSNLNCKFLCEPKPGSYSARNCGVKYSVGKVLAFTDADCIPSNMWIRASTEFFAKNECGSIAGHVSVLPNHSPKDLIDCHQIAYEFDQERRSKKGLSVTANLIVKRSVFDEVGFFREDLLSGGDWEWCKRTRRASIKMGYSRDALVFHPARLGWRALFKKSRRIHSALSFSDVGGIGLLKGCLGFVTFILPPMDKLFTALKCKDLVLKERIMAFGVAYVLRAHGKTIKLLSLFGFIRSTRS
jgi:glycosyltransferase involved in cell wall biosynthesis